MSNITLTLTSQLSNPLELVLGNALTAHSFEINQINPISVTLAPTLPCSKGETGEDGREIELRADNGYIQWKYVGEVEWQNLLTIESLPAAKGDDGDSAYDLWLSLGNTGSESDFLASLKGADGEQGLPGENGTDGSNGANGSNGASAYEVAIAQGFSGTAPQWLQSLVGAKGDKGDKGDTGATGATGAIGAAGSSAYEIAVSQGFSGNVSQWLISLVGANGDQGAQGTPGREIQLQSNSEYIQWRYSGDSNWTNLVALSDIGGGSGSGTPGLSAYDVAVNNGFVGTELEWLASLRGEQGLPGTNGTDGEQGLPGTNGTDGIDGESAYEIAVRSGFVGTELQWLASLKGETGSDGAQGLTGAAGSDGADGQDGASAYEVAVSNGFVGTEAAWLISLKGDRGDKGDTGSQGAPGADGAKGDTGDPGAGIAIGGTTGQFLQKVDSTNYNTQWHSITQDDVADGSTYKQFSATEQSKLAGIAAGAEVNVNADWNSSSGDSQILNKPTLGTAAAKDFPSSGNATSTQVVMGNDTRLSDSRTPSAHTHATSDVTGLSTELSGKSDTSHTHSGYESRLTSLESSVNGIETLLAAI